MTEQEQRAEALKRITILAMHPNVLNEFAEEGKLNKSENGGALYWLDEEQQKLIEEWEDETGNLVYHVIFDKHQSGDMLSLLYVSKYEEEWEDDRLKLGDWSNGRMACAYVMNLSNESYSEFGWIGLKSNMGGVVRTS